MRKYSILVLAVALFFAIGMMAQTSSGSSSTTGSDQTGMQSPQSAQTSTSDMGSSSDQKGKEKTVEGCVVRAQTDYFIFPKNGQPEHISSSGQDVSAHLGHHVKLHGTEQPSSSHTASGSTSGGTSGAAASNTPGTSGSSSGSTGNVGANTAGSVNESDTGATKNKEFVVERVDMVSESCPADIQKNIQSSGMSTTPR